LKSLKKYEKKRQSTRLDVSQSIRFFSRIQLLRHNPSLVSTQRQFYSLLLLNANVDATLMVQISCLFLFCCRPAEGTRASLPRRTESPLCVALVYTGSIQRDVVWRTEVYERYLRRSVGVCECHIDALQRDKMRDSNATLERRKRN